MRIPISVHTEPYDLEKSAQPLIDVARRAFADYLEQVPRRSTRSKHGLMGPVGKILAEVKSGRRDPASLKGYAVRVHEVTGRSPSSSSMEILGVGIDTLVNLLATAPVPFCDRILDRLDYGLYYDLRKRQGDSKEVRRQAWIACVRAKYCNEESLARAWDETGASFDELYLPKKSEGSNNKKATARQQDIAEFWETQGVSVRGEEEEE